MPKRKANSFLDMGLRSDLCKSCEQLGWSSATEIQSEVLPVAFEGKDIIALAETGSGKTGAFCLPLLQQILTRPIGNNVLILTPTRELALQIVETIDSLGKHLGVRCLALVGGIDIFDQINALMANPHILVATPGRLLEYLKKTSFNLETIKYMVFDEADKMLNMGFEEDVDDILDSMCRDRQTMLFSATMTSKVGKLKRAHLVKPVKIQVSSKFKTVDTLEQFMLFIPFRYKIMYMVAILKKLENCSVVIFSETQFMAMKLHLILKFYDLNSAPLYGKMEQAKRNEALQEFKNNTKNILVATDVCSRGLDMPDVNYVINFDLPQKSKDYIHRVGRTARAGRTGVAITMVSQYHIAQYMDLEKVLGYKLPTYDEVSREEALAESDMVAEAQRYAKLELKKLKF